MAALTAPFDVPFKAGREIRIQAAAVKNYRGGAAAVALGTGNATPLVPATIGHQFIGVYDETNDNSAGSPGVGATGYVRILRSGIFAFNQTGILQASVGQRAFFSDDNTVTTTAGGVYAGVIVAIDQQNSVAWVDIGNAVRAMGTEPPSSLALLAGDGAIAPRIPQLYWITKGSAAALTLAAPTAGVDDGIEIEVISTTAFAHVITATGLLKPGTAAVNTATFAAFPGAGLKLRAFNGLWYVMRSVGQTFA